MKKKCFLHIYFIGSTDHGRVMAISQTLYNQYHKWDLFVIYVLLRPETHFFVGKTTKSIFSWTKDSQCQSIVDSLANNTPNAPKFISPICLPKPKSLGYH